MNFWVRFAIMQALSVVTAWLATEKNLTNQQQSDLNALILAGERVLGDF